MKDIEVLLKEIIRQAKDKDAQYLYGVEYSSETDPGYKALVRFTKSAPVIFAASSKRGLKKSIKEFINGAEKKDVNIRYHLEQIELEKKSIRFHENLIHDYENPSGELPTE